MKYRWLVCVAVISCLICLSSACHRRKRRRSIQNPTSFVNVQNFFPACMLSKALSSDVLRGRKWVSTVAFTLVHSKWYAEADSTCTADGDLPVCWMSKLEDLIDSSSPALSIAKMCVLDYYRLMTGSKEFIPVPIAPPPRPDAATCATVDTEDYEVELNRSLNRMEFATDDPSLEDIDGLVQFVQKDMICLDCSCNDLSDATDPEIFDFEDGKSCGDCFVTRLPTAVRPDSGFRRPGRALARRRGGLRKRPRPKYPKIGFKHPYPIGKPFNRP